MDIQQHFWLRHIRTGFGVLLGETLVVMVYLGLTPQGPHRAILWWVCATWLVAASISLLCAPFLATRLWRAQFSALWTILSAFVVAGFARLDGGIDSPIVFLLFLPIALRHLPSGPGWRGAVASPPSPPPAGFVVADRLGRRLSADGALVLFAVLAGVSALSVAASVNRTRRERPRRRPERTGRRPWPPPTGSPDASVHRVFYERLDEEIARSLRHDHALSLMIIDVDSFKAVNDNYGHVVGDHVLAAIGPRCVRRTRRTFDVVGRLGGDEFAVLLPDTDAAGSRRPGRTHPS